MTNRQLILRIIHTSTPTRPPPPTTQHPMPRERTIPESNTTTIYYGGPGKIATSFSLGQGFESISFNAEHRRINREWADRRKSAFRRPSTLTNPSTVVQGGIKIRFILTETAKALIAERCRNSPLSNGESEGMEPALMPPSTKPQDYSKVSPMSPEIFRRTIY